MKAYYEARASEYDDWWLGAGLFAERDRPGWEEEREALAAALAALNDGSRWEVYKRYFTAASLREELGGGETLFDGRWFVAVRSVA